MHFVDYDFQDPRQVPGLTNIKFLMLLLFF